MIFIESRDKKYSFKNSFKSSLSLEPIGSVSPKINDADKISVKNGKVGKTINLIAPAQGYPTPVFRFVYIKYKKNFVWIQETLKISEILTMLHDICWIARYILKVFFKLI